MEDLKHFFLMICRGQTEQFFEWLFQYGNFIDVNYQLTKDDIKEIICEWQGDEFDQKDNTDIPGLVFNHTPETKMTLLLLALSLERISMAEVLLELCKDDIAIAKENSFGISAIHMLLMISFGDDRYDEFGKANTLAAPQVDLEDKIKKLIKTMIEKGHPKVDKSHNIIANAILHNHIDAAEELIKAGFPYPENNSDIGDIALYLINNSNSENALSRIIRIREIFSMDHHPSSSFFPSSPKILNFPKASHIKNLLYKYGISDDKIETNQLKDLLFQYLSMANEANIDLTPSDFSGWLSGVGKTIPEEIKDMLESSMTLNHNGLGI